MVPIPRTGRNDRTDPRRRERSGRECRIRPAVERAPPGRLYAISRRDGAVAVETLADRIASWQRDGGDAPDADAVRTSLVHAHLPKLDDADVVDYDRDRGTVEPADRAADLGSYLELTGDSEPFPSGASRRPEFAD